MFTTPSPCSGRSRYLFIYVIIHSSNSPGRENDHDDAYFSDEENETRGVNNLPKVREHKGSCEMGSIGIWVNLQAVQGREGWGVGGEGNGE